MMGQCYACQILYINGIRTHELFCPSAWTEQLIECNECGCDFQPTARYEKTCDSCQESFLDVLEESFSDPDMNN